MADAKAPRGAIDPAMVRTLADILTETGLTEIEVEQDGLRIRVARGGGTTAAVYAAPPPMAATPAAPGPATAAAPAITGDAVKSPMVGTVYLQPQPGAAAFVRVGDRVDAGQTLIVIEAMKTMNPIPAPRAGVIAAILVEDAQPVEFGVPLIILE